MTRLRNPVLVIALGVLGLAVAASFVTLGLAIANPVYELPDEYHWEGLKLDRDFERSRRAADLGVRAVLDVDRGVCTVRLRARGAPPRGLGLTFTHATLPGLDRSVALHRVGDGYAAPCAIDTSGRGAWRVMIEDDERTWSLRQRVVGPLRSVAIAAAGQEAGT